MESVSIISLLHDWSGLDVKVSNALVTVQSEPIIGFSLDQIKALSSVLTKSLTMCAYSGYIFKIAGKWKEQLNLISVHCKAELIMFQWRSITADEAGGY